MGKHLFRKKMSLRHFINHHMPLDGCILLFNVQRRSVTNTVHSMGVLELHKISDEPLRRGTSHSTPCDLYICVKENLIRGE